MSGRDSTFSVGLKVFANISKDNRIHLWDVETQKEKKGSYVDKNHLSHSFTCFAWNKANESGKTKSNQLGLFVMGFDDGQLLVWDLTRGVISKTIIEKGDSQIPTSIAFSTDQSSVLVSQSGQNQILQYNLSTGQVIKTIKTGKKAVSKMVINPRIDIIAVSSGSSIKIIDVESGRKRKLEGTLAGGVKTMTFTTCGQFLIASSMRSKEVLIFDVRSDAPLSPVYIIPVNGMPAYLNTKSIKNNDEKSASEIELLVIFEEKNACIIRLKTNYEENKANSLESVLSSTEITSSGPIEAGYLGSFGSSSGSGVVMALGQTSTPSFHHFVTLDSNSIPIKQIDIRREEAEKSKSGSGSVEENNSATELLLPPSVLGPNDTGGVKRPNVNSDDSDDTPAQKAAKLSSSSSSSSNGQAGEEDTLEQRLEALSSKMVEIEDLVDGVGPSASSAPAPTSDSLVTLLEQALQSGDDGMLEQCLACGDNSVVDETTRRLPASRVVQLLRKLVAKFEKRPSRGIVVTRWLASILRHHTAFLITVPDISHQLAGLGQMLENRQSTYTRLSALAGRLDLLLSQVVSTGTNGTGAFGGSSSQPQRVYREE